MARAEPSETVKAARVKTRDRSPNFPAITFEAALETAKKLWDAERKHAMGLDLALKRLGYTKNGRSMQIVSALKKYGLLVPEGDDVRVSDDANAVFLFPPGSDDREARIKLMAMRPSIFQEVLRKFPAGLPSDENLSAKLQHDMGFTGEAVGAFIRALRSAMEIAGVDRLPMEADTDEDVVTSEAASMPQTVAVAAAPTNPRPVPTPQQPGAQSRTWNLGDDTVIQVIIPPRLTKKNVEKLRKYVEVLASEASISWEEDDA